VARDRAGENPSAGLGRLPPGRHGLPREFVAENQRNRLTAAMIAVVAENGYHDATITQIAAAAGVSRRTFYSYFSSKEECYFDTYDVIVEHLREAAGKAAAEQGEWPEQARARIATALGIFSANPDLARFCLVAPSRAGDTIAKRFRQAISEVYADLVTGMPPEIVERAPSAAVQEALIGGIATLVVERLESDEKNALEELEPELVELFLSPYMGRDDAARIAAG
jgi:AcrR family transcriptional regulator